MMRGPSKNSRSNNLYVGSSNQRITANELSRTGILNERGVGKLNEGKEALHQSMLRSLLHCESIQEQFHVRRSDSDGSKEAKAERVRVEAGEIWIE